MSEGREKEPRTRLKRRPQAAPQDSSPAVERGLVRRPDVRVIAAPRYPGGVVVGGAIQPELQQKAVEILQHFGHWGGEEGELLTRTIAEAVHNPRVAAAVGVAIVAGVRPAKKPARGQLTKPESPYAVSVSWPDSDYSTVFLQNPKLLGAVTQLETASSGIFWSGWSSLPTRTPRKRPTLPVR
jgi:hypothetical protein